MEQTLVVIIGIGTGIAALGLLVQLGLWFAIYVVGRRIQKNVTATTPKIQAVKQMAQESFGEVKGEALRIRDSAREAMTVTKKEVATVRHISADTARLIRHEREMADEVVSDAVERARRTSRFVGRGIGGPVRGIAHAIRRFRHAA